MIILEYQINYNYSTLTFLYIIFTNLYLSVDTFVTFITIDTMPETLYNFI